MRGKGPVGAGHGVDERRGVDSCRVCKVCKVLRIESPPAAQRIFFSPAPETKKRIFGGGPGSLGSPILANPARPAALGWGSSSGSGSGARSALLLGDETAAEWTRAHPRRPGAREREGEGVCGQEEEGRLDGAWRGGGRRWAAWHTPDCRSTPAPFARFARFKRWKVPQRSREFFFWFVAEGKKIFCRPPGSLGPPQRCKPCKRGGSMGGVGTHLLSIDPCTLCKVCKV